MKELWESGRKSTSPLDNWVSDEETKRRYKRNGVVLGLLLALLIVVSGKSLCQLSTGSGACGIGSVEEGVILFIFTSATFSGLGWYLGSCLSTEHPAFHRFHIVSLALLIGPQFLFPVFLYQLQPQWKVDYWDNKWDSWSSTISIVIYLVIYNLVRKKFEREQLKM